MSELVDSPTSGIKNSNKRSVHFDTIRSKVPDWLVTAPGDTHRALRKAGSKPLSWFEKARLSMPDIARQMQQAYVGHWLDEQALSKVLARLPVPEVFAEPLLIAALKERFGLDIDVRNTYLVHAKRAAVSASSSSSSKDPVVNTSEALKAATQTLLRAALQNFEASEAEAGGMDLNNRAKAAIYYRKPFEGIVPVTASVSTIPAEQFAALCRELDLGGQYQALIKSVLNPPSQPGDAADAAAFNLRGLFTSVEHSAFRLQVHIAYMKNDIGKAMHDALLEVARNEAVQLEGRPVTCSFLRLWDIELTGIVSIGKARDHSDRVEKIVLYIPDDPICPLKEYASTVELTTALRDRMLLDGYLNFFQRFAPARRRNELFTKIEECLRPKVWNKDRGWYEHRTDKNAKLHLRERAFAGGFSSRITDQKRAVFKDDALFHAVPTAVEDQKTFDERVQYFKNKAFQVLNVAAFVVPGLGEVMLGVTAIQLGYEAFEGIESWARGEQDQAWGYLMDVLENVALMAALGAAGAAAGETPAIERIAVETPSFIEELKAVELPNGKTRLWKPDLAPFAHDIILPSGLMPDEFGLYHYEGKTWLALEDKVYSVKQASTGTQYCLEHPTKAVTYEPPLRHNGAGAWQHELDQPLAWEGMRLFRRLGYSTAEFSEVTARRILRVSDTREAVLRQVLSENQRPPALLEDTLRRFQLDQQMERAFPESAAGTRRTAEFDSRYRALSVNQMPSVAVIQRVYPELPSPIAEELVRHASPIESAQLAKGKVPTRIAEETRVYQQHVRLARAYEGLYLESVNNPDTDKLILHTLEALPGWLPDVRLEVRTGWFAGPMIDSVGPADAPIRKVLIKDADGYLARDAEDNHLHGRDNLYASVLHALPDAQRLALGFPGVWDGPKLKRAVQEGALLPRATLRQVLQMQPIKPGSKSPMRLADGRVGYPMSGEGASNGYVTRDAGPDSLGWTGKHQPFCRGHSDLAGEGGLEPRANS